MRVTEDPEISNQRMGVASSACQPKVAKGKAAAAVCPPSEAEGFYCRGILMLIIFFKTFLTVQIKVEKKFASALPH